MKKYTFFIFLFAISISLFSQQNDRTKTTGFFNITQVSYTKNNMAFEYYLMEELSNPDITILLRKELDSKKGRGIAFQTITGFFIMPKCMSVGFGLGFEKNYKPDLNLFPAVVDLRFYIGNKKRWAPGDQWYFYGQFGSLVKWNASFERGRVGRFGIGYKVFLSDKICLVSDVGLYHRNIKIKVLSNKDALRLTGLVFSVGLMF